MSISVEHQSLVANNERMEAGADHVSSS